MGMLLFDYLVHEGHWDTANRVAEDILLGRVEVSEEVGSATSKLVHTLIYSKATSASNRVAYNFTMQLLLTYLACICGVVVNKRSSCVILFTACEGSLAHLPHG